MKMKMSLDKAVKKIAALGVQRWTLIGGLLLVFLAGLFPPITAVSFVTGLTGGRSEIIGESAGRRFLLAPYSKSYLYGYTRINIDHYRLGTEWLTIASLTGAVFLIARKRGVSS